MFYIKKLYVVFSAAAMVLLCFVPICNNIYTPSVYPLSLWGLFGKYLLLIPFIIVLDTFLDGFLFMRFKFNFVFGEFWCLVLFYLYCRLAVYGYGLSNMHPTFYIAFIPGAVVSLLALSIRECDNSGMSWINKYDLIWLIFFGIAGILIILRCIIMKNVPSSLYIFDDAISKAAMYTQ